MIQSSRIWLSTAFTLFVFVANSFAQPAKNAPLSNPQPMLRVLILSGEGNHDWRSRSSFLRQLLLDTGRFDARLCESPAGLTAKTLSGFDAVVDDYSSLLLGTDTEKALETFVNTGKGLVVTYGGLAAAASSQSGEPNWPGLAKLTKVSSPINAALGADAPFRSLDLKIVRPEHPVMQGLKSNLRTADQPRRGFTPLPGAEVLATTDANEPLLFASGSGKGRVFCTALGHDLGSMQETAFITTFLRGTEWAASGKVTLPSEIGLPGPDTNAVRVLVITGGHDHEAAFYGLFDGYQDIGWTGHRQHAGVSSRTSARNTMCWSSTISPATSTTAGRRTCAILSRAEKASWCCITAS